MIEIPTDGSERLQCFSAIGQLRKQFFDMLGDALFDYGAILTSAERGSLRLMLLFVKLEAMMVFVDAFNDGRIPQAVSAVLLGVEDKIETFMPLVRSSIDADDVVNAARQLGNVSFCSSCTPSTSRVGVCACVRV